MTWPPSGFGERIMAGSDRAAKMAPNARSGDVVEDPDRMNRHLDRQVEEIAFNAIAGT
jgi:hypothetical protein